MLSPRSLEHELHALSHHQEWDSSSSVGGARMKMDTYRRRRQRHHHTTDSSASAPPTAADSSRDLLIMREEEGGEQNNNNEDLPMAVLYQHGLLSNLDAHHYDTSLVMDLSRLLQRYAENATILSVGKWYDTCLSPLSAAIEEEVAVWHRKIDSIESATASLSSSSSDSSVSAARTSLSSSLSPPMPPLSSSTAGRNHYVDNITDNGGIKDDEYYQRVTAAFLQHSRQDVGVLDVERQLQLHQLTDAQMQRKEPPKQLQPQCDKKDDAGKEKNNDVLRFVSVEGMQDAGRWQRQLSRLQLEVRGIETEIECMLGMGMDGEGGDCGGRQHHGMKGDGDGHDDVTDNNKKGWPRRPEKYWDSVEELLLVQV